MVTDSRGPRKNHAAQTPVYKIEFRAIPPAIRIKLEDGINKALATVADASISQSQRILQYKDILETFFSSKSTMVDIVCRLMDRNSTYCTSAGQVAAGTNIKPPYSHTKYTDLEIRIPKSELHLNGRRLDVIQIVVVLWDKSHARAEEICRSSVIKFCYEDRM